MTNSIGAPLYKRGFDRAVGILTTQVGSLTQEGSQQSVSMAADLLFQCHELQRDVHRGRRDDRQLLIKAIDLYERCGRFDVEC